MWILFVILLCYKQINSQAHDEYIKNMARAFPVQKIIPFHRNIQILNAQKFLRALPEEITQLTKKYGAPETYTVFPAIPTKKERITYFPIEILFGPNRLVRKVPHQRLLNYSRFKRSVLTNVTKPKSRRHKIGRDDQEYVPDIARIDKINHKNRVAKVRSITVTSRTPKIREHKREKGNHKNPSKSERVKKGKTKRHHGVTRKNKRSHSNKSRTKNRKESNRRSDGNANQKGKF